MIMKGEKLNKSKIVSDEITAYGHENILSMHNSTIAITKDSRLTKNGDCIIAVNSDKSCKDLKDQLKRYLMSGKPVKIVIEVDGIRDEVIGFGSRQLKLTSTKDIVIRKSGFIDDRTLIIRADKSAVNINRELIDKLKYPKNVVKIKIEMIKWGSRDLNSGRQLFL